MWMILRLPHYKKNIPHGTKHCLASADVGPAIVVSIPPDLIDLARKLKANIGASLGYALSNV
jgi:hypothetical protein